MAIAQTRPQILLHLKQSVQMSDTKNRISINGFGEATARRMGNTGTRSFVVARHCEGGLTPFKTGGGNESKTFHLKTTAEKEYSLRSINKSRSDVVPPFYKNTFVEDIINDGVSMSYPYGAFALPVMEEHADIYHANPQLVYLPKQDALDTFNKKYGNDLYLFEQRLDGDWSDAANLGNFKYFTSTEDVVKKLLSDDKSKADQFAFIKARLFDL